MRIRDILHKTAAIPYLTVTGETALEKAAQMVAEERQTRGIYVVDDEGRLVGYLSLGVLIRHVIEARDRHLFHVRSLLARITSDQVADLMERQVLFARPDQDVKEIVDQMAHRNVKQIPVVDKDRRIVANVGILDLWRFLQKTEQRE